MLTLPQLLRIPNVDTGLRFSISPNEKEVVFAWNKSGKWELWRLEIGELDASTGSAQRIRELGGDIVGSKFSPKHSPDGKYLAYVVDYDGSESYHIILHNLQNDLIINLTSGFGYAHQPNFDFSPDGKTLAILSDESGSFALYLLDIETQEKSLLLDIHRPIWDVTWSADGKYIAVSAESKASEYSIYVVEVASDALSQSKGKKYFQLQDNDEVLNTQHPVWSSDSKHLLFSCENGEWHNIGLYDVESKKITWVTDSVGDDTQPVSSRSGDFIGWIHSEGAKTNFQFRKRGGEIQQVKVGDGLHTFPQIINNEVILIYEDVNHPPDLWKINLENDEAIQLTKSSEIGFDFAQPEEIFYSGMDGVKVPALLFRAKDSKRAVIEIHGGPNWHYQNMWNPFVSEMLARGWNVLQPNYRGSTGYGKKWQNASRYDMGGVDANDCAAGVKFLIENDLAEKNKIVVTGRSHGGFLTMCCLTFYPDLFAGGSAVVPFMNWIQSHYESREDLQHWNIENMGDPEENKERWIALSPYFFLDKVNAPVQLICGGNDPRCPASDSIDARDKLIEFGKEVELLLYEDEGHSFLKIENIIDSETKRIKFLEKCFGGRVG
ncbi:MAG: S9 family peptidase [Anaerolineales bacterium]|nr:S9 family peptidase [Anaerolineales bacterium]